MNWSYGIITVTTRLTTTLPKTLSSLEAAGFELPRLFIDGNGQIPQELQKYLMTIRNPQIHPTPPSNMGNWILAAWELYLRNTSADYFALFEDDIVLCKNTRQYLESLTFPSDGYWNLYTPPNTLPKDCTERGFVVSLQRGRGALALVFNRKVLSAIFKDAYFVDQPASPRGWKNLDGVVMTAAKNKQYKEYLHRPSLVYHQQSPSSLGHHGYPSAADFPGEQFDAMEFLK